MGRLATLTVVVLLAGTGCASSPAAPGRPPPPDTTFHLPPIVHVQRWDDGGSLLSLPPLLTADFHGTPGRAHRASPWVYLPPLLYMDFEAGVHRRRHVLYPIGYHYERLADEESTWVVFPFWNSSRSRRWIRLADDEYREVARRSWGLFPFFQVEEEGGVTESLSIWPLLLRYEREGRRRVLRLFFLFPIPLGEESIEEAIRSPLAKVRWDAAEEIGRYRLIEHTSLLLEAMASDDRVLRFTASRSLKLITAHRARFRPDAPPEKRVRQIEKIRKELARR